MFRGMVAIVVGLAAQMASAETDPNGLSHDGAFDAVTINGFVLPLVDVTLLLAAGVLTLDPQSHHFSFAPTVDSELGLARSLARLPLSRPDAPLDLYRSAKVAFPNGAAHELTIPSGFGPATLSNQTQHVALSASLGGVSRVPYTSHADGALGFGLSFGNAFHGLGASVMASFNDLSRIGDTRRISWGGTISHYVGDGVSVAVGGENLLAGYTDGEASFYAVGSWAFDAKTGVMPFKGMVTLGAGNGRFADNTERDIAEGKARHGTSVFGGVAWEVSDHLNLITEWNGRNLNTGVSYAVPHTGLSVKLGLENLTGASGDGPIVTGSVGMTLVRF